MPEHGSQCGGDVMVAAGAFGRRGTNRTFRRASVVAHAGVSRDALDVESILCFVVR